DDVLLVGGATRMPMIRDMLTRLSGKEPVDGVNPDECVALGAALAGVFRHRPHHPALQQKPATPRPALTRPAPSPQEAPEPPKPQPEAPKGAVLGLAYGGHVAQRAAEASRARALPEV